MSQAQTSTTVELDNAGQVLRDRLAITRGQLLVVGAFAVMFLYYNYMPVFHSDIWGHVSYGQWILEHGSLPSEDPFVQLAAGVPITCTAWLGQVIFGFVKQHLGPGWVSHVFALTTLATWTVLMAVCVKRSGSLVAGMISVLLCLMVVMTRHAIVRPEIFGSLCFAFLLLLTFGRDSGTHEGASEDAGGTGLQVLLTVGLFLAWANLHGSFVTGYAVLGCWLAGRAADVLSVRWQLRDVLHDRVFWRRLLLCEAAVAASLVNPYGMDLLIHTLLFPQNPNLKDVLEWFSLEMVSVEGIQIGVSWFVLAVLLRHSRVKFRTADVLMLGLFTFAVVLRVRMQTWYGPVFAVVLAPHIRDVLSRVKWPALPALHVRSIHASLVAVLVVWMGFAFSPLGNNLLGSQPRAPEELYSEATPLKLTRWLREHPPQGQIMNPQWWGDWLVEHGPPDLRVFMTTNAVHASPQRVWKDYLTLARAERGFEVLLNRYRINTVIVHKELQTRTARTFRDLRGWEVVYEDDLSLVAQRDAVIEHASQRENQEGASPVDSVKHERPSVTNVPERS